MIIPFLVINGILLSIALIISFAQDYLISYGECALSINGEEKFKIPGGENLLNHLTKHKIFIPSACGGKATCGYCKVTVLSGGGNILPTEEPFVDRKEVDGGVRLACQVKVRKSIDIQLPEFLLGAEEFNATVETLEDLTHDIKFVSLKLQNSKKIIFRPGQYIQIKIPGTDEFRAYSIASPPYITDKVELTIRLVPGGLCSTYIHKAINLHDKVIFTGPFGDFALQDTQNDVIGIAGGCGMAPIRSIVKHMAYHKIDRKVYYFFGARTMKDLFFTDDFRKLENEYPNFKYIPALSEPKSKEKWDGEVGLITNVAEKYLDETRPMEAYLCGPPPMIDAAEIVLRKKNIQDIYFDKF